MAEINPFDVVYRFLCAGGDQTKFNAIDTALDAGVTLDDILGAISTSGAGVFSTLAVDTDTLVVTADNKVGFFGAAPVVQASHIADSAGDDATAVNAILLVLENLGLVATS